MKLLCIDNQIYQSASDNQLSDKETTIEEISKFIVEPE